MAPFKAEEGRSIREIAESLGIKTKTAYARLHLAREHLKTLALA
ncbi:sigma factor-like helix-turn-helix DNA-binding protein [Polyangium fumosum]|uniref:Sigma-70 family RNA polymerase sigma factor n=1 Tax=Polyangium fumosum TaxID=889272 RepID=A0A4U1J1S3_9BACT|nr:sigma factor-like helix-turn-helix DNA-binding protein [Polyangium fumosum]TKD00515.1 sigma-70 family RNA polymerase sigma factor [Polyangium fumosum]